MAQLASLLVPIGDLPKPDLSWISNISKSLGEGMQQAGENKSFGKLADVIGGAPVPEQQQGGFLSRLVGGNKAAPQQSQGPMTAPVTPVSRGPLPASFQSAVDRTEGGGNYDTLFGHAQKNGPFAGTAISQMPIKDVLSFTDPSGQYAQYVKGKVGRVATPVGKYQVVGTTLRNAVGALGLDPNAPFDQAAQDQVASYLARNRINQASTVPGQIRALRAEWEGFKNVPDAEMAQIVQDLRNGTGVASASPMASAPNEVASLDPSIGIPMPGAAGQIRASDPAMVAPQQPATAGYVDPQVTTAAQQPPLMQPQAPVQPVVPQQVADGGSNILAQGITPIQRGGADPAMIQFMLRDPNLRQAGLQLWQQNVTGKTSEPWQFVTLPDGTLARANQQTGQVEKVGQFSKPQDPISVSEGETLLDPVTRQPIYQGQRTKPPEIQEFFDDQTGQAYKAEFDPQTREWKRVGGAKAPNGMSITTNPDGTVSIQQGVGGKPKLTEAEARNSGFLVRAKTAQETLNKLEDEGTSVWNATAGKIPLAGNYLRSEGAQKYDQAKRNFINAQLRRESGAVISPEEFANAEQQYFPQPGDGPEVIQQKRINRQDAIRGLDIGSGAGSALTDPTPSPAQAGNAADLDAARDAIRRGAPRDKVIERLRAAGIDTEGL